jgi:hypothetical protein
MKALLRVVAIFVGLAVVLTVLQVARFTFNGDIAVLVRSGALGVATIAAWFVILTAGPIASVQLMRLRRSGLYAAAVLSALSLTYYVAGLCLLRTPEAPLRPLLTAVIGNGVVLAFLFSLAARRACV